MYAPSLIYVYKYNQTIDQAISQAVQSLSWSFFVQVKFLRDSEHSNYG